MAAVGMTVPRAAAWLGVGGLLPFLGLAAAPWLLDASVKGGAPP